MVRSVLWIGRGERFAAGVVADAPTLDVVWERDAAGAARLALEAFHAVVLDAETAQDALDGLAALAAPPACPVLVLLDPAEAHRAGELRGAGAADVMLRGGVDGSGGVDGARTPELLEQLERLARVAAPPAPAGAATRIPFPLPGRPPIRQD